jgi:hypothetical protein
MLDTQENPEREFTYDGDKVKSIHVRDRKRREYQYSDAKLAKISLFFS